MLSVKSRMSFERFALSDTVDTGGTGFQNLGKHADIILERFLTMKVYQTFQTREAFKTKQKTCYKNWKMSLIMNIVQNML